MNQQYKCPEEEFDDYLDGGMNPGQRADFEARLAADLALREAFDFHQIVRGNLHRRAERAQIEADVARIHREMLQPDPLRRLLNRTWGGFFLLLLVAAGVWYFWPKPVTSPTPESPEPAPAILRQDSLNPPTDKRKNPVAVDKNKHIEKEESGPRMGSAPNADTLSQVMPARQLKVLNGKAEYTAGEVIFKLTVYRRAGKLPESSRAGKSIQLYTLNDQLAAPERWRLLELVTGARKRLYLQADEDFYLIEEGNHYLVKESEEAVLKWLRQ